MGSPKPTTRRPFGLGSYEQPPDARVPVTFQAVGGYDFDQLVAHLHAGGAGICIRVTRADGTIRRGTAIEVDESNIVRVQHYNGSRGTYFLLSMVNGRILGEFTD